MAHNVNAEIVAIGTEILLGELTDTNSVFIARLLRDLGINLYYMTSVGDNRGRIADAIRLALSRAEVVITCGGLGPTVDDMTRESVADATDRGLTFHQALFDQIAARFVNFRAQMTENNRQQAFLPDNALVIENPVGTAPSFIVEHNGGVVISLPGVPREMKFLMTERVVPYLREKYQLGIIKAHTLKAAGIGESALDDMLGRELLENANPSIGLAAHHGEIDVRITAKADTEAEADVLIAAMQEKVMAKVGKFIYGANGDTIEQVLVDLLLQHSYKLVVVQAGIGGIITQALLAAENGAQVIAHSQDLPTPQALLEHYGLDPAMSLREASKIIAEQACKQADAYAALVVISEPEVDEASDNTEGSVVTVYTADEVRDRAYGFGGRSEVAASWMTRWSLANVWRMLSDAS